MYLKKLTKGNKIKIRYRRSTIYTTLLNDVKDNDININILKDDGEQINNVDMIKIMYIEGEDEVNIEEDSGEDSEEGSCEENEEDIETIDEMLSSDISDSIDIEISEDDNSQDDNDQVEDNEDNDDCDKKEVENVLDSIISNIENDDKEIKDLINKFKNINKENNIIDEINKCVNGEFDDINKYGFIEVCAGGGGFKLWTDKSGLKPILLNDINKDSCETLKLNHPNTEINMGSFTDIDYHKYVNKCDILCGGVPCQSFSYAGKQLGLNDKRGDLIIKFSEMVNIIKPKIFMIENVKGLLTHNNGNTIKNIIDNFINKENLYNIKYKLIKCVKHTYTYRERDIIIIGILKKYKFNFEFPRENNNIITLKQALKDVPKSEGSLYSDKKILF